MEVISPARKGMKTKPMIQNLIPFPVDTWRRFNVCLTTHSRRIEVETTSYVYSKTDYKRL